MAGRPVKHLTVFVEEPLFNDVVQISARLSISRAEIIRRAIRDFDCPAVLDSLDSIEKTFGLATPLKPYSLEDKLKSIAEQQAIPVMHVARYAIRAFVEKTRYELSNGKAREYALDALARKFKVRRSLVTNVAAVLESTAPNKRSLL
ncbi:MAG: hypothetical protein OXF68_05685 [Gammaproteobacteria bacterium]|nr:hypothetical protein [Gammaproteobacteria bacterium]